MEKSIVLEYDYSSPEMFWADVHYQIKQEEEGKPYEILDIYELDEEIIVNYKLV